MTRLLALLVLLLLPALPAVAQPTNAEVLGRLAAECLSAIPRGAFALDGVALPASVRAPLHEAWQRAGRRVYADTTGGHDRLRLDAAQPSITYVRASGGRYRRIVRLVLPYALVGPGGEVLRSGTCAEEATDSVARRDVARFEDASFPETIGVRPPPGWVARYAEPVLLGGAVVVSTLLFFSLRSR